MNTLPESGAGKWTVGLTLACIMLLMIFFLFMAVGMVDFDTGHWWDVTLGIAVLAILFLLTHSFFIHD